MLPVVQVFEVVTQSFFITKNALFFEELITKLSKHVLITMVINFL